MHYSGMQGPHETLPVICELKLLSQIEELSTNWIADYLVKWHPSSCFQQAML